MNSIKETPWDAAVFGIDTYELETISIETMKSVKSRKGHYTARVNSLESTLLLHEAGFYYCDTLLQPYCTKEMLKKYDDKDVTIHKASDFKLLLGICHGAFRFGRFHRDPNIHDSDADRRYDEWLHDLYKQHKVFELRYDGKLAGFIGVEENTLILHAVAEEFRGRGLAKYLWSALCSELFNNDHTEILSSISAANVAALNLYISLGFRIRNSTDIYHYLNKC